ncbi:MAG: hypothetical protein JXN64_15080 [Spirochaetes bacterium]|nr:hypothetical protein [Spirochaetota bacterium]
MKLKLFLFSAVITGCVLLFSSSAMAFGLGVYGTASKGSSEWTFEEDDGGEGDYDSDTSRLGLGFTLDTALAIDRLFNYRLHVGYSRINIEMEDDFDVEGLEFHLYNSFGFGLFRSEVVRIWLGPQIGFGIINAEFDYADDYDINEFVTFYFAYGIIGGINFNIGNAVTIAVDGGYRFNSHAGYYNVGQSSASESNGDITGSGKEAFIDVAFMFRIGDTF